MSGAARVLLVAAVVQQGASWGVLPRPACPWGRPALRPAMAAATRCCAAGASGAAPGAGGLGGGIPEHCWDAHNHLQLSRKDAEVRELVEAHQMTVSLMGTQPADWAHARALAQQLPRQIRPSYGLHPWWAHEHPPPAPGSGWMHALQTALEEDPRACLGEIGLDGQWVPPGLEAVQYEQQVAAFREQLQLAVLLRRPVSVHCVKAYGDMFDTLRTSAELPPAVYMHSWGGKLGMLQSYVKMKKFGDRFYFGFSAMANLRDTCRKTSAVIAAVPDDRLLLESDLEEPGHVVGALERMLQVIAEAKGWSVEEAAAITQQNAKSALLAVCVRMGCVLHMLCTKGFADVFHPRRRRHQRFYESGQQLGDAHVPVQGTEAQDLARVIAEQGDKVRQMKAENKLAPGTHAQSDLDLEIARLKALKHQAAASCGDT